MKDDQNTQSGSDNGAGDARGRVPAELPKGGAAGGKTSGRTRPDIVDDSVSEEDLSETSSDGIEVKPVEHTMEDYFLRYSMSVIVDRAYQMFATVGNRLTGVSFTL